MSDVELLTSTIDDVVLIMFHTDGKRYYLFDRFPEASSDEMINHVLNTIVPIVDEYGHEGNGEVTRPFFINEHCAREVWNRFCKEGFSVIAFEHFENPQKTYKIRSKTTGQFSSGGKMGWSKKGKVWSCYKHLLSHIAQQDRADYHENCEVVVMKEEKRFNIEDIDRHNG